MKKILFLFLIISTLYKGQVNSDIQPKQLVPFPTSAESYSLSKMEKIPVDYFRGKANINIPIYTISVDGINIPISLSYNTGGIKLNEISSIVGLGWALNIPGSISQNMIGLDDLLSQFFSKNIVDYDAYNGYFDEQSVNNQMRANLSNLYNNTYDTKKDIFDYNFPTASGSFILKDNNQAFLIPNDDVRITRNGDKFYVKDTRGTEYWVSPKNGVESMYIGGYSFHKSLYGLDSLKTNNNVVRFSHNKGNSYTERNINQIANFKITPDLNGDYEQLTPLPKYEKTESSTSFSESLISKIQFDNGEVTFLYSNDANSAFSDGLAYRKDLSNNNMGIALRRIIVTNKAGVRIKDISLNYSYFESSNVNKTYEDYRLKLNNVHDNLQNNDYSFEYNEQFNLPKRSSSNDDYWGYINTTYNNEVPNIPNNIPAEYGISSEVLNSVQKRDREPNETYAILGSLKSIKYPTGAKKNFYYELPYNTEKESSGDAWGYLEIGHLETDESEDDFSQTTSFPITSAHMQQISNLGINATPEKLELNFSQTCDNADNPGNSQTIEPGDETSCTGTAKHGQKNFAHWRPQTVDWNISTGSPLELSIFKIGKCKCNIGGSIRYKYPTYTEKTKKFGGLRILKMEDVDENNVSNVYEYEYGKYQNGAFVPDFSLNQPYNFSTVIKRYARQFTGGGTLEKYYRIHNSSQANNNYGSSDIVTYPSVTEKTGKGKIIREFENYTTSNYVYNKWKTGNLKREIYLNQNNDTLRIVDHTYKLNTLKNSLSEFTTNDSEKVAFSTDFDITKTMGEALGTPVDTYFVEHLMYFVESAKVENDTSEITEYFNGKKVITRSNYEYYDTDINKPINVRSTESILPSGERIKTNYSYAQEKGNQLLISKNMVSIPLETETKQTIGTSTKTLSKSEILYPLNQAEADRKTSGLVLPTSVLSYDLQNPTAASAEVAYDKYDSKGNLQQYTTKAGIPVAIIWGYNNTQPIAKIEGATYSQVESLISDIITASNTDALAVPNNDETSFLSVLNSFRTHSALSAYQISTYTYDPLIGVRSITPSSGIREVYIYDSANRLKEVREDSQTGKLLKELKYNYKN
jgi:hypothetical protein